MAIRNPVVLVNGTLSELPLGDTLNGVTGGGGITVDQLAVSGMVVLDFGTGSNVATTQVMGQTDITDNSQIDAWIMGVDSVDHNAYEHMIVPMTIRAGSITPGVGFEIMGSSPIQLTGQFVAQWVRTH